MHRFWELFGWTMGLSPLVLLALSWYRVLAARHGHRGERADRLRLGMLAVATLNYLWMFVFGCCADASQFMQDHLKIIIVSSTAIAVLPGVINVFRRGGGRIALTVACLLMVAVWSFFYYAEFIFEI